MRALNCKAFGPLSDLVVEDVPDPVPGNGQVLIDVKAAGLNFPDVLCVQGQYQFKPPTPFVPGQEGAGVIAALGNGVSGVSVGDKVAFMGLSGAFAEKIAVPANRLLPVPEGMPFDVAAGLTMVYGTSLYALKQRGGLQPGETLLVLGAAGGVGLSAVEIGKAMGAKVIAAASTNAKLDIARAAGADECINYTEEDLKKRTKELTGGQGVDVIYDPVGGQYAEPALRAIGWGGRYLVIGFAAGDIPKIPLNLTLLKSCQIVGVFYGAWSMRDSADAAQNLVELQQMFERGDIKPLISERYPLEHVVDGLRALADRKAVGKLVVIP